MEKITYILGAGFSQPAGLPLMNNFIIMAKDMYFLYPEKYGQFQKIFKKIDDLSKIKNFFNSDLYDIEEVLSLFETEAVLSGKKSFKNEFIQFIIDVIQHYTFESLDFSTNTGGNPSIVDFGTKVKRGYASFLCNIIGLRFRKTHINNDWDFIAEKNPNVQCKYSIITLNYDTILENCSNSINQRYRINPELWLNKKTYDPEWHLPHLIKLHGCVKEGSIIPPTWSKNISPLIEKNWKNAYDVIKDSTQIRFIGYSLPVTDSNVRYLIKSAIVKNQALNKIDVICLESFNRQIKSRYDEFINFKYYDFYDKNTSRLLNRLISQTNLKVNNFEGIVFDNLEAVHLDFKRLG